MITSSNTESGANCRLTVELVASMHFSRAASLLLVVQCTATAGSMRAEDKGGKRTGGTQLNIAEPCLGIACSEHTVRRLTQEQDASPRNESSWKCRSQEPECQGRQALRVMHTWSTKSLQVVLQVLT